jgi:hypothetical protein
MWPLSILAIVACGVIAIGIAGARMNGRDDDDAPVVVPFPRAHERAALRTGSRVTDLHPLRIRESRVGDRSVDPWNVNGDEQESDPRRGTQADSTGRIYRGHGLSGAS